MKTALSVLIILAILISCDKEKSFRLEGSYEGEFYRTKDDVKVLSSTVTFAFEGNRFSGSATNNQSPAICNGTYSTTQNEIEFVNGCFFTANFDWTLILSGKFMITENSEELIFSKKTDAHNGDYYVLKRVADPR